VSFQCGDAVWFDDGAREHRLLEEYTTLPSNPIAMIRDRQAPAGRGLMVQRKTIPPELRVGASKRVAFARAMALDRTSFPREPSSGLAPITR